MESCSLKTFQPTFDSKHARIYTAAQAQRLSEFPQHSVWLQTAQVENSRSTAALRDDGLLILRQFFDPVVLRDLGDQVDEKIRTLKDLNRIRHHRREIDEGCPLGDFRYLETDQVVSEAFLEDQTSNVAIRDPLLNLRGLDKVILDERLISLASAYHGCVPKLTFVKVFKSFANNLPDYDAQLFHADTGSYWILKALIYLNDVDSDGGPFTAAIGSQKLRFRLGFRNEEYKLRYSNEEVAEACGEDAIYECCGTLGDIALAETTGFHKGKKPMARARRVIIANYCVHDEIGFDYNPINIGQTAYDNLSPMQKAAAQHLKRVPDR